MKRVFWTLPVLLLCTTAGATKHVQVKNQAWVDKVGIAPSSHALRLVKPFIKVNLSKLDGRIVEVGFRNQQKGVDYQGRSYTQPWINTRSVKQYGNDYFGFEIGVSSDFHRSTFTGPFYVKTDKDTYYWIKAPKGKDFTFDNNAYSNVERLKGGPWRYDWDPSTAVPTQRKDGFGQYYNPNQLK